MNLYLHEIIKGDFICANGAAYACLESAGGIHGLTVFILACFVGYYVVWKVTPALHAPLMSVTNAISSVIIIGAILAASNGSGGFHFFSQDSSIITKWLSLFAILLVSINIIGGFMVTHRMLKMFHKK